RPDLVARASGPIRSRRVVAVGAANTDRHDVFRLVVVAGRLVPCVAGRVSICREWHHHNERSGWYGFLAGAAGRLSCSSACLCCAARQLLAYASSPRTLWRGAGCPAQGKGMIDALAVALGLSAQDPFFWMPLVFMLLFFVIIVAGTVLDGFDIGVG